MHACGLVVVCVVVIVFVDVADVVVMIVTDAIIIVAAGLVIAVCPCIDCIRLLKMKIVRANGFSHRWEENGAVIILT